MGLYPNIPHKDGLNALMNVLDEREDKTISTESGASNLRSTEIFLSIVVLHLNRNAEQQLTPKLPLRMQFCLWLIYRNVFSRVQRGNRGCGIEPEN